MPTYTEKDAGTDGGTEKKKKFFMDFEGITFDQLEDEYDMQTSDFAPVEKDAGTDGHTES